MIFSYEITKSTDELKRLLAEHPDYPIAVVAGESANSGDYPYMYCSSISFSITEILDCEVPYQDEFVEVDRDHFNEQIEEWLWDYICDNDGKPTEDDFQKRLAEVKAKYEPYWKKVIEIYADN